MIVVAFTASFLLADCGRSLPLEEAGIGNPENPRRFRGLPRWALDHPHSWTGAMGGLFHGQWATAAGRSHGRSPGDPPSTVRGLRLVLSRPAVWVRHSPDVFSRRRLTHPGNAESPLFPRGFLKSGRHDSNMRPPGPKPGALARLSYAPMIGSMTAGNSAVVHRQSV